MGVMNTPAFAGANFDSNGGCIRHPDVRLTQKMFTDEGKVVYKELMRCCPKCIIKQQQQQQQQQQQEMISNAQASDSSYLTKSQQGSAADRSYSRNTNSYRWGNSKNNTGSSASKNDNPLARSASRSRSRARSKSRERDTALPKSLPQNRSVSRPRQSVWGQVPSQRDNNSSSTSKRGGAGNEGSIATNDSNNLPAKKVFDSPFDPKGRCHYHPNISLAKKKLTGGWKVLLDACPKCLEERYVQDSNNSDNRSVGSRRSTKSDNRSVSSRHSTRSDNSRHSSKSNQRSSSAASSSRFATFSSAAVRSPSAPRSGRKKTNSAEKAEECPFDNQGCCRIHHHVRLAKKKLTGGWKIIQDTCPECEEEDNCSVDSRTSRFSRRSVASKGSQKLEGNTNDRSTSSGKSKSAMGVSGGKSVRRSTSTFVPEDRARREVEYSTSQSDQMRTKLEKMHVTADDDNREDDVRRARLGGEGNERTRGQEKSSREKETAKDKQYSEKRPSKSSCADEISNRSASAANWESIKKDDVSDRESNNATTPKQRSPKESKANCRQRALKEYKDLYESAKVVKNMMFIDVHGDAGRYTGDVNEFRMPHGQGNIIYEHGLVQGGNWTNGVLDEDSMCSGGKSFSESKTLLSNKRVGVRAIDP